MLQTMGVRITNKGILNLYSWNYVLVVAFSALLYWGLTTLSPIPVRTDDEDLGKLYLIDGLDPEVMTGVQPSAGYNHDGEHSDVEKKGFESQVSSNGRGDVV